MPWSLSVRLKIKEGFLLQKDLSLARLVSPPLFPSVGVYYKKKVNRIPTSF